MKYSYLGALKSLSLAKKAVFRDKFEKVAEELIKKLREEKPVFLVAVAASLIKISQWPPPVKK